MNELDTSTPLDIHTLTSLCDELTSGRPLRIGTDGERFELSENSSRSIFQWYRQNRSKWRGNVMRDDVLAIAERIRYLPVEVPRIEEESSKTGNRLLHVRHVKAHNFGGIQRSGESGPTEDFEVEFDASLTLLHGSNGAGKTAILNAICWCLSGYIFRPQREPESGESPITLSVKLDQGRGEEDESRLFDSAAIVPVPSAEYLSKLESSSFPIDTWAEVVLADDQGNEYPPIRRTIGRTSRGKLNVDDPDLSGFGLDPIAFDIGTRMAGLIPHLHLGEVSDFGKAVASMTGIQELRDLVSEPPREYRRLISLSQAALANSCSC